MATFTARTAGGVEGDPHFTTFDGLHYDYQGAGDFVLTRSTAAADPFEVQIRTRTWHDGSDVSIVSKVAAKLGDHLISFDLDRANAGESFVWIDGRPLSLRADNPVLTLDAGRIVELSPDHYQVIWNAGEMLDITNGGGSLLNVAFSLSPRDRPGSVEGLLGNDNGWTGDDFQVPDGTLLDPQIVTSDLYDVFANAWRVTAATSLLEPIPEPGTLTLLGIGLAGFGLIRRRVTLSSKPPAHDRRKSECRGTATSGLAL
jgi:hypothetical protein